MPELPEVETLRRGLEPLAVGRRFRGAKVRQSRLRKRITPGLDGKVAGAKLEALENGFRGLLNNENIEVSEVRSVHNKYVQLSDRIAQLEFGGETSVQNDEVPMDQFQALYEAIKSSHIGLDDLQYAPLLRKTPDARFETHQKLLDLKHQLWPNSVS